MKNEKLKIAMMCYPNMTLLDLAGPEIVLSKYADIYLVWKKLEPVNTDTNISINPTVTFANCPPDLDMIFVPGGPGTIAMMQDMEMLSFIKERARNCQYITSVCTGSLILAAAGLLKGVKATTHWSVRNELAMMGAKVVNERVVCDGNRITGGGITSGIDFGLEVIAKLINEDEAKATTLFLEYDPCPPYLCGTPEKASEKTINMLLADITTVKQGVLSAINKAPN